MRYVLLLLLVVWWLRRHPGPCPWFLTALLENGYMEAVAGHRVLLSRLHLAPGMSVLDVGCGPGRLTLPVARAVGPSGRVVGLDVQPQMLARLSERARGLPQVETVCAGAGASGLAAESFDRALLVTVLGEIPDRAAALAELYSLLRPGGILSVTEVIPDPHYQSRASVVRQAEAAGFRLAEEFGGWVAFTLNFSR